MTIAQIKNLKENKVRIENFVYAMKLLILVLLLFVFSFAYADNLAMPDEEAVHSVIIPFYPRILANLNECRHMNCLDLLLVFSLRFQANYIPFCGVSNELPEIFVLGMFSESVVNSKLIPIWHTRALRDLYFRQERLPSFR